MKLGRNMKAFLTTIRSEPGQWTTISLAKDFGVEAGSARRTLRKLEDLHLIWRNKVPCEKCARDSDHWHAVDQLPGDSTTA